MATFVDEDDTSMVLLKGSPNRGREDQVGTACESSHIATGPLKRIYCRSKFVVPGKQLDLHTLGYDTYVNVPFGIYGISYYDTNVSFGTKGLECTLSRLVQLDY